MENLLTQITDYLLTQSLQIAVLVVVIAAVNLALKNRSAHVRYLLWLIVLAKCLVPPLFTVPVAVLPEERPAVVVTMGDTNVAEPPILPASPVVTNPPAPTVTEIPVRLTIRQWLGLSWIAGVAAFVLFAVVKALRTNFWLWRQRKLLPAEIQTGIENLFSNLDLKTFPKVWLVEGIGQPFVWGLLRGSIYLPADFVKVNSAEHRRGVLGHELSHILRFDAAVNILQIVAQGVFWFHPLIWWANKKIRGEREKCCDETAIARLGAKAKDYSSAIVEILTAEYESTRPVPSLAVAGPVKNIEERIKTMMRPGKKFYKRPSLIAATIVMLIALATIPTAFVLTVRGQAQPATQSSDHSTLAREKSEQPRFAGRTFNSEVEFDVWVQDTFSSSKRSIGGTPSTTPLEIPACWLWGVKPLAPVNDWDVLVREISQNEVPGLRLDAADSDLKQLAGLAKLRSLNLSNLMNSKITDAGLEHIKGMTGLQNLNLLGTKITDAGLEHIKGMTGLQNLNLTGTKITDAGLEHLKGMTGMQRLDLIATKITDAGLEHLKGMTNLRGLDLTNTNITDFGLEYLKGMSQLEELSLPSRTSLTGTGFEHINGLTGLKRLYLGRNTTDAGLEHLEGMTGLETLWLSYTSITDAGLKHLKGLTGLKRLDLVDTKITDAGLEHLKGLTGLETLYLWDTLITDAGMEHLTALTGLQILELRDTKITDKGLEHLKGMTGLQSLGLPTATTDMGLEHIKGLTGLKWLYLDGPSITDKGLEYLKDMTALKILIVDFTNVTDEGLEHLKGMTSLQYLRLLRSTKITDAGLEQLKQSLPNLKILTK